MKRIVFPEKWSCDEWYGFKRYHFEFENCKAWIVEPEFAAADGRWSWCTVWPEAFVKRVGIVDLLEQEEQLSWYVSEGNKQGCVPITRVSDTYPLRWRERMGPDAPGCLWAKGDLSLLDQPMISLVGSRELRPLSEAFAAEVGRQAALQGYVLVSGNAKGADSVAQNSALAHGGKVISVVADALQDQPEQTNVLYLSEMDYDVGFSAARALSRNRTIHALGSLTLVAQCTLGKGGSWDGSVKNLKYGYSPLFVLDDGSEGAEALIQMGAEPVLGSQLEDLSALKPFTKSLIDQ